uniref:EF-hand domain-containing protein n=1 Tax=Strigamia maritima TaxID=126957 RepID=T1IUY5_STRMM
MADLSSEEVAKAKLVFDVYDFEGNGKIDSFYLGEALRATGLNPTIALIEKMGGTKKTGEKSMAVDEFLPIYSQIKKDKDSGTAEDFLEGLKVYDKAENGCMMAAELAHVLLSLGEKLTDAETMEIIKICAGTEDDEGFIKYEPFIKNVVAGPFPEEAK